MSSINYDLTKIKGIAFDVDGVLSPSVIPLHPNGEPMRCVSIKDGYALQLAVKHGYKIAIITGGKTEAVRKRFEGLGIQDVILGASVKITHFNEWLERNALNPEEVVYVGGAADLPFLQMHKLTLTADLGYRLSPADVQALSVSAGAEYAWRELVMLRGGYHCGDKKKGDASYATAGAGVEYAGVRLDFAWLFAGHEYLARNTFWVSLGYSF